MDFIFGGHDHIYHHEQINENILIKSGSDFRNFSVVNFYKKSSFTKIPEISKIVINDENVQTNKKYFYIKNSSEHVIEIEKFDVTVNSPANPQMQEFVDKCYEKFDQMSKLVNCYVGELMDCRFNVIRSRESNLGNFVADLMRKDHIADIAFINSGALRADKVYDPGFKTVGDWMTIAPFEIEVLKLEVTGKTILECLEISVSSLPDFDGRFLQVSGLTFTFSPTRPKFERINPKEVFIGEELLDLEKKYILSTSSYLYEGNDGYNCLKSANVLIDDENAPTLMMLIHEFFRIFI